MRKMAGSGNLLNKIWLSVRRRARSVPKGFSTMMRAPATERSSLPWPDVLGVGLLLEEPDAVPRLARGDPPHERTEPPVLDAVLSRPTTSCVHTLSAPLPTVAPR